MEKISSKGGPRGRPNGTESRLFFMLVTIEGTRFAGTNEKALCR